MGVRFVFAGGGLFVSLHIFVSQISLSLVTIADLETLFSLFQSEVVFVFWRPCLFQGDQCSTCLMDI